MASSATRPTPSWWWLCAVRKTKSAAMCMWARATTMRAMPKLIPTMVYLPPMKQSPKMCIKYLTNSQAWASQPKCKNYCMPLHLAWQTHEFYRQRNCPCQSRQEAHIIIKVNAMTEKLLIDKLYEASQAGVKVNLIIRSMCCIRPQLPGVSDNITVRSIVGRFGAHTCVYYFANGHQNPNANGKRTYRLYCASADWMERNLFSRVEVAFPLKTPSSLNALWKICTIISKTMSMHGSLMPKAWRAITLSEGEAAFSAQDYLLTKITRKANFASHGFE